MSEEKMRGPFPSMAEVEEHHRRYGGGGCFAPWLMRDASDGFFTKPLRVIGLTIANPGTPDARIDVRAESFDTTQEVLRLALGMTKRKLKDCEYEFCALSHDGTPMPRVEASGA